MENKTYLYECEASRIRLAGEIAAESMVLLKNEDQCLPLSPQTVAFFGRACYRPNLGGMGSGMSFKGKEVPTIYGACEKAGLIPEEGLHGFYKDIFDHEEPFDPFKALMESGTDLVASGIIYDIFGRYNAQIPENAVPEILVQSAARRTDTAVFVFGRNTGGEECDRRVEDDYYLLDSEKKLIDQICQAFPRVIVLMNINGVTDFSWISDYESIKAVVYIGTAGEQGPEAVARLLTGEAVPSGKLSFTVADAYEAYPTAETFSYNKDVPESIKEYKDYGLDAMANGSEGFDKSPVTLYREGLYMGYRYFDSFGKKVLYPFGYGLSYADFQISKLCVRLESTDRRWGQCVVKACVRNVSERFSGKEVVQVYISAPDGCLEKPYQSYIGCAKTGARAPGAEETVTIRFDLKDMASYDEARGAWILEPGKYFIRVGNCSRNTHIAGALVSDAEIICEQLENALSLQPVNRDKINFMTAKGICPITYDGETGEMENAPAVKMTKKDVIGGRCASADQDCTGEAPAVFDQADAGRPVLDDVSDFSPGLSTDSVYRLCDVKAGRVSMKTYLSRFTTQQLMALAVGYGPGLPFGGMGMKLPCTIQDDQGQDLTVNTHKTGNMGYVSPAILEYGIPSAFYKDGPAGVGMTAWPTGMTLACSFNTDLFYAFGAACGYEARIQNVDSWLAPALNLHRNPIGGRNFEYFSEDPYVAGICGLYICRGSYEKNKVTCCPKHFALNEQETYRRGSSRKSIDAVDTIVTERVARELYLKPFEMVLKNAPVTTLMTSFNKINGTFAGGSYDLCTKILRDEWGFNGVVVTDWGDMDIVVDGADAVAAGNDVVMPGGPPVIEQIQKGFEAGRVNREQLEKAVAHLLNFVGDCPSFKGE